MSFYHWQDDVRALLIVAFIFWMGWVAGRSKGEERGRLEERRRQDASLTYQTLEEAMRATQRHWMSLQPWAEGLDDDDLDALIDHDEPGDPVREAIEDKIDRLMRQRARGDES